MRRRTTSWCTARENDVLHVMTPPTLPTWSALLLTTCKVTKMTSAITPNFRKTCISDDIPSRWRICSHETVWPRDNETPRNSVVAVSFWRQAAWASLPQLWRSYGHSTLVHVTLSSHIASSVVDSILVSHCYNVQTLTDILRISILCISNNMRVKKLLTRRRCRLVCRFRKWTCNSCYVLCFVYFLVCLYRVAPKSKPPSRILIKSY